MDKQNINEELEKFKLLSSYSTKETLTENMKKLQEQGNMFYNPSQPTNSLFPINCSGVKVGLPTTAVMQQNFATNSGLNPNVEQNKIFFCDSNAMNKKLLEIRGVNKKNPAAVATAPKFVAEKFPLKYMMQGEKVKQLQTALGVKNKAGKPNITGKFYTATETSIIPKAKELGVTYTRESGVSEDLFNKIVGSNQNPTKEPNRPLEQPITNDRKRPDLSTGTPKTISTQTPTIQTPTTELSLEQQFQMAKINLDKAKQELDDAQATKDRAKIGAARGKQQAARKEVQRLRNELYPPQQ